MQHNEDHGTVREPVEGTSTSKRRHRLLHPAALVVAICMTAATAGGIWMTMSERNVQSNAALTELAQQTVFVLTTYSAQIQALMSASAVAAEVTDGDATAFAEIWGLESPRTTLGPLQGLTLLRRRPNGSYTVHASVGRAPLGLPDLRRPATWRAFERAARAESFDLVSTGESSFVRYAGLAFATSARADWVVYAELVVPKFTLEGLDMDVFPEVNFAIYLGDEALEENLAFGTTRGEPLTGHVAVQRVQVGELDLLLVVEATSSLNGPLTDALPWLVPGLGLVLTVVLTVVVHSAMSRRVRALALADHVKNKNLELDDALAEQFATEQRLAASEARLQNVLDHSPDTVMLVDGVTGAINMLNRDAFLGHCQAQLRTVTDLDAHLHPDDREELGGGLTAVFGSTNGKGPHMHFRLRAADGSWEWVRSRTTGLGGVVQSGSETMLCTLTVITTEIDAETARRRLEEQLRQSQKLQAVGQLAGGVAHDFNNLLAVIQSYAELLADDLEDEAQLEDLEEIRRATRRGGELSRQLLAFSREGQSKKQVLDLDEHVQTMENLLRRTIGEAIDLTVTLCDEPTLVQIDPIGVEQILMNLAVNARDAMSGEGQLLIQTRLVALEEGSPGIHEMAPGRYVQLTVTDSGVGMSRDVQQRALEPFYTTKEPGAGTGLGLATVYGIVRDAGGDLSIYSEQGVGTSIKIFLPEASGSVSDPLESAAVEEAQERAEATILLVEDEQAVREATRRILERAGYEVLVAPDGLRALSTYEGVEADLLLTDMVMPGGLSGTALAARLRGANPELGVVYMSGYSPEAVAWRDGEPLDGRLLEKPFTRVALLECVRDALVEREQRSDGGGGAASQPAEPLVPDHDRQPAISVGKR